MAEGVTVSPAFGILLVNVVNAMSGKIVNAGNRCGTDHIPGYGVCLDFDR